MRILGLFIVCAALALAGCTDNGPQSDSDGGEPQGTTQSYGPGATGGMSLNVGLSSWLESSTNFVLKLYSTDDVLIWSASGTMPGHPADDSTSVLHFDVENHPDEEGQYRILFEANGMKLDPNDDSYGVSEWHDDAIQLWIQEDGLMSTQAYY